MLNLFFNVLSKQKAPIVGWGLYKGDKVINDPTNEISARAILNLGIDYDVRNLSMSVNAYNILNKHFYQGGDIAIPLPQQGFNFMAKVAYKF